MFTRKRWAAPIPQTEEGRQIIASLQDYFLSLEMPDALSITDASSIGTSGDPAVTAVGDNTYSPTITNGANVTASTPFTCQYLYINGAVVVSGAVNIDPTLAATVTDFEMTLPISTTFGAGEQLGGGGGATDGTVAPLAIYLSSNAKAKFIFTPPGAGAVTYSFVFLYRVN